MNAGIQMVRDDRDDFMNIVKAIREVIVSLPDGEPRTTILHGLAACLMRVSAPTPLTERDLS